MPKTQAIPFTTTFSRYKSIRLIGEGGTGYVYEVVDDNGAKEASRE
jgi:hypothetical protein